MTATLLRILALAPLMAVALTASPSYADPPAPAPAPAPVVAPPAPAAPAPAKTEPAAPASPRFHVVGTGDSLSKISKQYYGTANRWNDILQANRAAIPHPDALALGTKLRIP